LEVKVVIGSLENIKTGCSDWKPQAILAQASAWKSTNGFPPYRDTFLRAIVCNLSIFIFKRRILLIFKDTFGSATVGVSGALRATLYESCYDET
jgi:hypothetical protein